MSLNHLVHVILLLFFLSIDQGVCHSSAVGNSVWPHCFVSRAHNSTWTELDAHTCTHGTHAHVHKLILCIHIQVVIWPQQSSTAGNSERCWVSLTANSLSLQSKVNNFNSVMLLSLIIIIHIAAAKRCYENLRRTFLEQQAGKEEFIEQQSKRRKYRSRCERVNVFLMQVYMLVKL